MRVKYLLRKLLKRSVDTRRQLLKELPRKSTGAEIGVWKGDFSERILRETAPTRLYLIDPWEFQSEFKDRMFGGKVAKKQEHMDDILESVKQRLAVYTQVIILRKYSSDAVNQLEDNELDWVYIDGNHYYEYVLADLKNYFSKVKPGGLITGDDYHWSPPDVNGDEPVRRAVQDFMRDNEGLVEGLTVYGNQFLLRRTK